MADDLEKCRGLDASQLEGRYNKPVLAKYLADALSQQSDLTEKSGTEHGDQTTLLELKQLMTRTLDSVTRVESRMDRYETRMQKLEIENSTLKKEIKSVWSAMDDQVRYLEKLDSRERANKFVVFGVPENAWQGCSNDADKISLIATTTGCQIDAFTAKRVGTRKQDPTVCRPIHVTLTESSKRNQIVEKLREIFNHSPFANVRVKKDVHPAVRREWGRLYASFDKHKNDPGNAGHDVDFDKVKRCITRDNVIVEAWRPRFSDF